jgi:signal transduction histidine kinase
MSSHERKPRRKDTSPATPARLETPTGDSGIGETQRLATLLHEIRGLLDGSLRYVLLARRAVEGTAPEQGTPLSEAQRQLGIAAQAMERMSGLAHAAMQGPSLALGSALVSGAAPVTMAEAVRHAVDVMRPKADEHKVQLKVMLAPRLAESPAGPLYTLLLNTLRNAVDANIRAGGLGQVEIAVVPSPGPEEDESDRLWMSIDVRDEGDGILPQVAQRAFEYAYSGTGLGSGIGLAVARSVVEELGGRISIATRKDRGTVLRPGACLHALVPVPGALDGTIGEGA